MSDQTPERTPEQKETDEINFHTGRSVSLQFMRRHPDFIQNEVNQKLMVDFVKTNGGCWDSETLEKGFQSLGDKLELEREEEEPVVPSAPVEEKPLPPWGKIETKADVKALLENRAQYKRWLQNPDFVRTVNTVLQKGGR
jgi:hypothetical protein